MGTTELVTNLFEKFLSACVANGAIIKWKQDRGLFLIQPTATDEAVKVQFQGL